MSRISQCVCAWLLAATTFVVTSTFAVADDKEGKWEDVFDGKSLENWDGNPDFWSVEDGAITGQTTKDKPTKGNTFIIWRGGEVADFELTLEFKIIGGNSGIQYRSFEVKNQKWVIGGYQADFEAGTTYSGINYGERTGRGILAGRGTHTTYDREGKKTEKRFGDSAELQKKIKKEDWNVYHIIAKENHCVHKINGVTMSELTDSDKRRLSKGVLALQLHAGPPMKVQFRKIRILHSKGSNSKSAQAAVAPAAFTGLAAVADKKSARNKRVAFLAGNKSHGYGSHEHKAGNILLARKLEAAMPNVDTAIFTDGWPKDANALDGFDCIVMYCDGGGRHMVNPHLEQVNAYAKQGVGIVCIHYGVEVPKGPSGEAFLDWIGGYFEANWSVNPHWTAHFNKFPKHAITTGVKPFATNDEWYYHMRFRPDMAGVTPILTDLPPSSTLVKEDGSLARPDNAHNNNPHVRKAVLERKEVQHVAWATEREDGGRGFGFTGGHYHWNWGNPNQLKLMLNAIVWCAKADVPKGGVSAPEVTLDELRANQDYEPRGNFDFGGIQKKLDEWHGRKVVGLAPAAVSTSKKNSPEAVNKPLFKSEVVTGKTPGDAVNIAVDLKGVKQISLVVTDGGNGFSCDWADWINPTFLGPAGMKKLTELKWKSASAGFGQARINRNNGGSPAVVDGKTIENCIGTHANSVIVFDVPEGFDKFSARGGLDAGGVGQGACGATASVQFLVYAGAPQLAIAAAGAAPGAGESREADDALSQLDVAEGLEATLFASEKSKPALLSPSAIDIDHLGRVWVCEVVNYRHRFGSRPEGDRILVLEDTDGDGVADKQTVFHQGRDVDTAHGICVLGNRVIVSGLGNVFSLYDDDGDLKSDRKETHFTGIGGAQHDHGIHAFAFGPDGKLYFNFGNFGGQLKDKDGKPVVDLAGNEIKIGRQPYQEGMVFRCDLDCSNVETLGWNFRNNWEVCVDSFGTLWQSDNDDDGNRGVRINYVMEYGNYGYKDELTGAGWKTPRTNLEKEIPLQHWHLNDPGVIPNVLQTGQGAPTGIVLYEGTLLGDVFQNQMIHCDAGPNIVRAYPVKPDGAGYSAHMQNMLHGARDKWFRPSDVCIAPDGSVIVADWYDPGVGGHRMGDIEKGRLFRIAPPNTPYKVPKYDFNAIEGAIVALQSPNLSARYLAWQKLHGEGEKAEGALLSVVEETDNPRFQARALWLLGKMKGRGAATVELATEDDNPDIRILGIRLARQLGLDLIPIVRKLAKDESAAVRRDCAIALRFLDSSDKARLWAELAVQHDGKDRWYLEALGIGAGKHWDACLTALHESQGDPLAVGRIEESAATDIFWRSRGKQTPTLLARGIAQGIVADDDVPRMMRAFDFVSGPAKDEALFNLAFGYTSKGNVERANFVNLEAIKRLQSVNISNDTDAVTALNRLLANLKGTSQFVSLVDRFAMANHYPALLELALANSNSQLGADAVRALLSKQQQDLIRKPLSSDKLETAVAAANVLGLSADGRAPALLLPIIADADAPAELRRQAAQAAASSRNGALKLLEQAEKGELDPALTQSIAARMHSSPQNDIRARAIKLFPLPPAKNGKPMPPITELIKKKGDINRGRIAFETTGTCANCHVVNRKGKEVGPNLSEIGKKLSRTAFFESVLFPSAGISHNYEMYSVVLTDGNVLNGVMPTSTDDSVTIKDAKAISRVVKRSNIEIITKQKISIMPADLQKLITEQELVDIVEYLQTLKQATVATTSASR